MYDYMATVVRVVDGDTLELDIDLGFDPIVRRTTVRLAGINAPELKTQEGIAAAEAIEGKLQPGKYTQIEVRTFKMSRSQMEKRDDWRRYLAIVYLEDGTDLNKWMLENNYATPYGDLPA